MSFLDKLENIAKVAISPLTYPTEQFGKILENTIRGDFSDAWDLTTSFAGDYNRELSSNLIDSGFSENNWMVQNPLESIGMAVAGGLGYQAGSQYAASPEGASMIESGTEMFETGKEWYDTASKANDAMNMISGSNNPNPGAVQRRTDAYSGLIGRLSNTITNEIDPFEEIVIPTGARY